MKRLLMSIGLGLIIGTMVSTAWAQQRGGQRMKQMYSRNYDINSIETIKGEVVEISHNPSKKGGGMAGVHVVVRTESETIPVHLGPAWYMSEQDSLNTGDKIEVTGSRITYEGAHAIVAATVKRNEMTLRLRDQNGYPVWRGWKKSHRMNR